MLDMTFAEEGGEGATPYEVLLHAAMIGDSTHFTRQDSVEETWRVMQPLLDEPPEVQPYAPGRGARRLRRPFSARALARPLAPLTPTDPGPRVAPHDAGRRSGMKIAITGASGLMGTALVPSLRADGHDVVRLVRRTAAAPDEVSWDPHHGTVDLQGSTAPTRSSTSRGRGG